MASYETQLSSVGAVVACQQGPIADRDERYGFRFEAHLAVEAEHGESVRFDLLAPSRGSPPIAFHCWEVLVRRRQDCANILGTPNSM